MNTSHFDYELPSELIAQSPAEPRDASRLMVLHRNSGALEHRLFRELPGYLSPGDLLVLNDSRVLRARLKGHWSDTGGQVEALLVRSEGDRRWLALLGSGRRSRVGLTIAFSGGILARVDDHPGDGLYVLAFEEEPRLETIGELPLPPYIHREPSDPERYQTVYARAEGSIAAPTAGLHFTPTLLSALERRGVRLAFVTLHVGLATFRPVQTDDPREHSPGEEFGLLGPEAAELVLATRGRGGRVVSVGTTSVRLLEQWAAAGGSPDGWQGWTSIYILPGHEFRAVDAMITNFHLPRTTLLMLVSAFAGREQILAAYQEAIRRRYRFYSFGDAMLIL